VMFVTGARAHFICARCRRACVGKARAVCARVCSAHGCLGNAEVWCDDGRWREIDSLERE